jgi:hypothetical protein
MVIKYTNIFRSKDLQNLPNYFYFLYSGNPALECRKNPQFFGLETADCLDTGTASAADNSSRSQTNSTEVKFFSTRVFGQWQNPESSMLGEHSPSLFFAQNFD